jgi:hypothetical protein
MSETQKTEVQKFVKSNLKIWKRREKRCVALALVGMTAMIYGIHGAGFYTGTAKLLRELAGISKVEL